MESQKKIRVQKKTKEEEESHVQTARSSATTSQLKCMVWYGIVGEEGKEDVSERMTDAL